MSIETEAWLGIMTVAGVAYIIKILKLFPELQIRSQLKLEYTWYTKLSRRWWCRLQSSAWYCRVDLKVGANVSEELNVFNFSIHKYGGIMFSWNVGIYLQVYPVLLSRRQRQTTVGLFSVICGFLASRSLQFSFSCFRIHNSHSTLLILHYMP